MCLEVQRRQRACACNNHNKIRIKTINSNRGQEKWLENQPTFNSKCSRTISEIFTRFIRTFFYVQWAKLLASSFVSKMPPLKGLPNLSDAGHLKPINPILADHLSHHFNFDVAHLTSLKAKETFVQTTFMSTQYVTLESLNVTTFSHFSVKCRVNCKIIWIWFGLQRMFT